MIQDLATCPFCGHALTISSGHNPCGRCNTPGCWLASRRISVPADDPKQVAEWNARRGGAKIRASDLAKIDQMISLFDVLADRFSDDFYDDLWNFRNRVKPFAPGDAHYDQDYADAVNSAGAE